MAVKPSARALRDVQRLLSELTASQAAGVRELPPAAAFASADAVVHAAGVAFHVEWKDSGDVAHVAAALLQMRAINERDLGVVPLVAVPYMSEAGRLRCEEAGVSWIDLSGNARISAPGLLVRVEGRPNRFKARGRPRSLFAPKSSRVTRYLLTHVGEPVSQREIAGLSGLDEGYVSRIVRRLEDDGLVTREPDRRVRASDPGLLLDAWRDDADFQRQQIVRGHVAARTGDELQHMMSELLQGRGIEHASTGLGAAWLYAQFAMFRLATFYVAEVPEPGMLSESGFRQNDPGPNLWLVVPDDAGVFDGVSEHHGVRCVAPVQAYVDLKGHPERAAEAANELRRRIEEGWASGR